MDFVGRQRELEAIEGVLTGAHAGRGGIVIVSGEPGIGKTRLAREACARAEARGQRVAWGRAWEAGGAPPGWPVTEIVREIATDAALAALGPKRAFLHAFAPELVDVDPPKLSEDRSARFRACEAVQLLAAAVAEESPLVLVFDDLHAADATTIETLHFLSRSVMGRPVGILVTWRPHEARRSAPAPDVLSAIAREATMIDLGPLSDLDAGHVARRALGDRVLGTTELRTILEAGQGNPLFVEELARGSISATRLPGGLDHAIRGHLARLDDAARALAELASVFGRRVDRGLLMELGAVQLGLSAADVSDALGRAIQDEVLGVEGPSSLSFVHILVRDALYEGIAVGERRRRHAAALEAMMARGTASASELAFHAVRAYPAVEAGRVLELAARAAAEARRAHAFSEAAAVATHAIAAVSGDPGVDRAAIAEMELELARDEIMAGRVELGKEIAARIGDAADRSGDVDLLARAALIHGTEFVMGRSDDVLLSLLRRARERLPASPSALRARILARYGTALFPDPEPRIPTEIALEAVAMARATGDPLVLFEVLYTGRLPLIFATPVAGWRPLEEEALALAREHGDEIQLVRALAMAFMTFIMHADIDAASAVLREATEIARRFPEPQHRYRMLYANAMEANRRGDFDEAQAFVDEAEHTRSLGSVFTSLPVAPLYRFGQIITQRRWAEVDSLKRIDGLLGRQPSASLMYAMLMAEAGNVEEARARLAGTDREFFGRPAALVNGVAKISVALGDRELVEHCYQTLMERRDELILWGFAGFTAEGSVASTLGRLAAALGRLDDARAHFAHAIEVDTRTFGKVALAHDHADWAEILRRHGDASHRDEARTHRQRADALYRELGLLHLVESPASDHPAEVPRAADPSSEPPPVLSLTHEGATHALALGGERVRVRDSKGIRYLAILVEHAGRAVHVLDLVAAGAGVSRSEVASSDAGPVLDERAREAYRQKLSDLAADLEEAEGNADLGRAERVQAEIDALVSELTRALGLGGRARRAGSTAERARVNVQRRLKSAIAAVRAESRPLGEHLERSVRTGAFCIYDPPALG